MLTSILFREQTRSLDEAASSNSASSTVLGNFLGMNTDQYITIRNVHTLRIELYDKLAEFFPESLTQPRVNLIDLLPL